MLSFKSAYQQHITRDLLRARAVRPNPHVERAKEIKVLRERDRMTTDKVADALGIDRQTVLRYMHRYNIA